MSKNKNNLLSEAQIRRMMGLAGIQSISERHSSDLGAGGMYGDRDEDEVDVEPGAMGDMEGELGGDYDEPAPEGELDAVGPEGEGEGVAASLPPEEKEDLAAAVVQAVAQELEAALALAEPIEVSVDSGPAGEEPPMGGEELEGLPPMEDELPGEEEEELELSLQEDVSKAGNMGRKDVANKATGRWLKEDDAAGEELEESADEELKEGDDEELAEVVDDEAIVNEVMRRVVARLSKG